MAPAPPRRGPRRSRRLLAAALLAAAGCAAPSALGGASTAAELGALRRAMAHGPGEHISALSCELRLRYSGAGRRYRGTLLMWLQRPDRLRLHVLGPQGSPMAYLVMGDGEVAMVDFAAATVDRGPATAATLDRLLPLAPVGLDAHGWVRLLLGEVAWPENASGRTHRGRQELSWQDPDGARQMHVELELPRALLRRLSCGAPGQPAWSAEVVSRDAGGLPAVLEVAWAPGLAGDAAVAADGAGTSELRLREVETNPSLPPGLFALATPPGFSDRR